MKPNRLDFGKTLAQIRRTIQSLQMTAVTAIAQKSRDPFRVLISCLISLRTKDEVTNMASARLFAKADTAAQMRNLSTKEIAKLIFPAGFYRTKARRIREISQTLINEHHGRVPDTLDALLHLKGVGRKTANLVLTVAYHKPGICVDTHVHRITNRLGWVQTPTPEQTEMALRKILPKRYWIPLNDWLVTFGQNICQPVSPWCSRCPLEKACPQIGVKYKR